MYISNLDKKIKFSVKYSLIKSILNKWVVLIFLISLCLLYLNQFVKKIIFNDFLFQLWLISENIIYSLIAASIFYFFLEVLPKIEAIKQYYINVLLMQEDLTNNLKFLNLILTSVPDNITKIEKATFSPDLIIPESLGQLNDNYIVSIINKINEKTITDAKTIQVLYGQYPPKNISEIMINNSLNHMIKYFKLSSEGEISKLKQKVDFYLNMFQSIRHVILEDIKIINNN
tara:strand:- start:1596 stop:2285 length:690 start_codon:yes stop_codon:yes gene_type:complete